MIKTFDFEPNLSSSPPVFSGVRVTWSLVLYASPPVFSGVRVTRSLVLYVSGAETAYPSGAPEFTPVFSGVRVTRSLVLYVCFVDGCLFLVRFVLLDL